MPKVASRWSDALHYIQTVSGANQVIDVATLTGDVETALGDKISGVMGNSERFTREVLKCSKEAGEPMHELPLFEEYRDCNKGVMADLNNSGTGPGAISAGWFLREFIKDGTVWVHMDMAGTSFRRHDHGVDSALVLPVWLCARWASCCASTRSCKKFSKL
jgi:leucyl aminopeptidase